MSTVDATTVAHEILSLCDDPAEAGMTQMKLLKLVYIAHGWMLGLYGEPLIQNRIEAWRYGPVIPALRKRTRPFGADPVTKIKPHKGDKLNSRQKDLIEQVWDAYGKYSGIDLSGMTHRDKTPWYSVWHIHKASEGDSIPNNLIQSYYESLADGG